MVVIYFMIALVAGISISFFVHMFHSDDGTEILNTLFFVLFGPCIFNENVLVPFVDSIFRMD